MTSFKAVFVVLALVCIQQGLSLKCHQCTLSDKCNAPVDKKEAPIVDCDSTLSTTSTVSSTTTEEVKPPNLNPKLSPTTNEKTPREEAIKWKCGKLTVKDGEKTKTDRQCVKSTEDYCGIEENAGKEIKTCVICDEDECNGASALMMPVFIVGATLASLYFL